MSLRPWRLENYDLRQSGGLVVQTEGAEVAEARLEEARLEGFDHGYKAGWDDATKAHAEDQRHISAELAHNLQAMAFTYQEARQAVMRDTEVLFRGMIDVLLPKILPAALTATVLDRLLSATNLAADAVVEISVAPENLERLQEMIADTVAPPLRILPEPSLGTGQAALRFGNKEERVDLEATLTEIDAIVDDLFAPETLPEDTRDAG